jgi:hypothetical protein
MQSDSGLSFKSTFIRFSIEGASLACKFNLEQSLSYSTTVYSGCKPFQKLVPYFELNRTNLYCPKISGLDDSIPCTNYNDGNVKSIFFRTKSLKNQYILFYYRLLSQVSNSGCLDKRNNHVYGELLHGCSRIRRREREAHLSFRG